jgi:hypothetical protein
VDLQLPASAGLVAAKAVGAEGAEGAERVYCRKICNGEFVLPILSSSIPTLSAPSAPSAPPRLARLTAANRQSDAAPGVAEP